MESYKIYALKMRFVVPLTFDSGFDYKKVVETVIDKLSFSGWKPATPFKVGEADVFYQLTHEFDGKNKDEFDPYKMGSFFHKDMSGSPLDMLFVAKKAEEKSLRVSIKEAGLYIFRTGIGLLWYETELNVLKAAGGGFQDDASVPLDSNLLLKFQYNFRVLDKTLKAFNAYGILKTETDKNGKKTYFHDKTETNIRDWLTCIKEAINAEFLASREREEGFLPDKALLFTHAVFDPIDRPIEEDEKALQAAFCLTNGYKPTAYISSKYSDDVVFPFSYLIWSATKEGCGLFVWPSGENPESVKDYFCAERHMTKVLNDYFAMYIRALYISYSLYRFSGLIASDKTISCYYGAFNNANQAQKIYDEIKKIDLNINIFLAKSMVTSVSHIHHQNDFYSYLIERLRIKQDIKSVTSGLDALKELSARTVDEKKRKMDEVAQEEEKKSDNRFQAGLGVLSLLSIFSAFADAIAVALYFKTFVNVIEEGGKWFNAGFIMGVISLIFCVVLFIIAIIISGKIIVQFLSGNGKKNKKKTTRVAAAIIKRDGRIYATQRGYGEYIDGWEFPGGKIDPGETPEEALVREIKEELCADIIVGKKLQTVEHDYPDFHLSMDCFWAELREGSEITLMEHESGRWLELKDIDSVDWLEADLKVVEAIKEAES